jgi:hypothetical protein
VAAGLTAPPWVDELDLHVGPPAAAMSTRSLDDDRWLLVDDDWVPQRDEARRLLRSRRAEVLVGRADDAVRELTDRIDAWLAAQHPTLVDPAADDDALGAARARVAEDLCILTPGEDGWLLTAGAVCFPSYWRPTEKIGRPLDAVHDPVPGYPGALAGRVDGFLGRLRAGQGVWRRNWSIHAEPDLFAPDHGPAHDERWLRSEYQTLVRLESVDAVVFTIRTQQVPLTSIASRPDVCTRIAAVLRGWSPEQRAYKGAAVDDAVLAWLDASAR